MSREIRSIEHGSNSVLRSKSLTKSPLKFTSSKEAISSAGKHTIPIPFVFNRMIKEKKYLDSRIFKVNLKSDSLFLEQKSSRFTLSASPRRSSQRSPRLYKSSLKVRTDDGPISKKVQFHMHAFDDLNWANKQKQWRKIFNSIKSSHMKAPIQYNQKDYKKKSRHTITEIIQM